MMGLRVNGGIDQQRYFRMAGRNLPKERLTYLEELRLIELDDTSVRATRRGRIVLNSVLRELIGV